MNIEKFIITVQWGKGMHYITGTCSTLDRASKLVAFHKGRCDKKEIKNARGAKATVRSWQLLEEI